MIRFLLRGLLRDRSRSLFPVLICAAGVGITFLAVSFLEGYRVNLVASNAHFSTGHVKVCSHAYAEDLEASPLELSLESEAPFVDRMRREYPEYRWTKRTRFGGLLDIPDAAGETRSQAPVGVLAMDFLSPESREAENLGLSRALRAGTLIRRPGDILLSAKLAERLGVQPGETRESWVGPVQGGGGGDGAPLGTLLVTSAEGASVSGNFRIVGTVTFGIGPLDRSTVLMDVADADLLLDMESLTAELLGFRRAGFDEAAVTGLAARFNQDQDPEDPYRPHMVTLLDQEGLRDLLVKFSGAIGFMVALFLFLMTLVLWNAAVISGIRRYNEIGLRLSIGERRSHIVASLLGEALLTGLVGTTLGILLALGPTWYLQEVGVDYSRTLEDFALMMQGQVRAEITPRSFWVAILPGLSASFLGTLMASAGIYRRSTASLFKELEH